MSVTCLVLREDDSVFSVISVDPVEAEPESLYAILLAPVCGPGIPGIFLTPGTCKDM